MLQGEAVVCRDLAGYAQVTNSMTEPATDVPQLVSGILLTTISRTALSHRQRTERRHL